MSSLIRKIKEKIRLRRIKDANFVNENCILNIGKKQYPKNNRKALIIYNIPPVIAYVKNCLNNFGSMNYHSMYWETVEMIKILNSDGYLVDFLHFMRVNPDEIQWAKYDLIIDSWDYLKYCPEIPGQKKIFYATGLHWLIHNIGELSRIRDFYERYGILLATNRQIPSIMSDKYADYITYFGNEYQMDYYDKKAKKVPLNISCTYIPNYVEKNIDSARYNFLWLGGGGMLHKGLDLVVEAFAKIPQATLHIVGNPKDEPLFWNWLKPILDKNPNIILHGWMDVSSDEFINLANSCIGTVYASCSEGGPGSVAQALTFGLIPIVTPRSNVRGEKTGYLLEGDNSFDIINSIIEKVEIVMSLSNEELLEKSKVVRDYALENHTRVAYSNSFRTLLTNI